jgi:hypothetical protein
VSVAVEEVKRRLEESLPGNLTYTNTVNGLTDDRAMELPKGYYLAPESLTDDYINCVLVGADVHAERAGGPTQRNVVSIVVYLVNDRIRTGTQVKNTWDRGEVLRDTMLQFLRDCVDPEGRTVWRQLVWRDMSLLPEPYQEYSGIAITYTLVQDPSDQLWATAP